MKPLDLVTAQRVVNLSGGDPALETLARNQLKGAVALYNMVADPEVRLGYLADEVGMGKTYVALAVVALMRCFNPTLKVLYICPSRNVQEKWGREYGHFIKKNVLATQLRIRTPSGKSAVPMVSCRNVSEMIRMASTGYYADYFVGKDSFSISLANDESAQKDEWNRKVRELKKMIPAREWQGLVSSKQEVKEQYARALNYVLPRFDLVVIDEAHNFKHNFESSDRNRVLSRVLGFSGEKGYFSRVDKALLLSATPYDRDINQLRNQLSLVGKRELIPDKVESSQKDEIVHYLRRFMVRRLNTLEINNVQHTRNMYRYEHRRGSRAEIALGSDEQKLVTALVQKKVGEMLNRKDASPAYQIGMMASFESYAQTARAEVVQFDGDVVEKVEKDARDRHVVGHIVESYKEAKLGRTLPHPKMDRICQQLADEVHSGKKQLVFVRRVKSVGELKSKLDDHYSEWLIDYIRDQLAGHALLREFFDKLYATYQEQSRKKDGDISGGEFLEGSQGDTEDNQPPKNDTLFTWFFRGGLASGVSNVLSPYELTLTTPDQLRRNLTAKNQLVSLLMELNWTMFLAEEEGIRLDEILTTSGPEILLRTRRYITGARNEDYQDIYWACQLGFLEWYNEQPGTVDLEPLINYLLPTEKSVRPVEITLETLASNLQQETLFTKLRKHDLASTLFPLQQKVYDALKAGSCDAELLDRLDTHGHLVSLCLRTGHGIVDFYLARLRQGAEKLTPETRRSWLRNLMQCLKGQAECNEFSTYRELKGLSDQLDLIIRNNIPGVFDESRERRRTYVSHQLNPVSPVIGASGETVGSRSAQARKFRMPGYPLALITTDVFQEGEDLHTFCDSVVHYGLSGSPVSIEQKTGRVDRVNSMAQRRLSCYQKTADKDDLIQVRFPYVKESIEQLQVRQLCQNINRFIESLHEVGSRPEPSQDQVDTVRALSDKSDVPEQIWNFLKSPYEAQVPEQCDLTREWEVLALCEKGQFVLEYVHDLVEQICGVGVFLNGCDLSDGTHLRVRLDSARGCGESILIAECKNGDYTLGDSSLKQWMLDNSWRTLYRTQAEEIGSGCYRLTKNVEMLVGDDRVTQSGDVESFFSRFTVTFNQREYQRPTSAKILGYVKRATNGPVHLNGQKLDVQVELLESESDLALKFHFGDNSLPRSQSVLICESGGYCLFLSKAVSADQVSALGGDGDKKIIECTWLRNKYIDVAEFLLDFDGGITGRVLHPVESLDWEEFIYCSYVLAVEADRLEYIFSADDAF